MTRQLSKALGRLNSALLVSVLKGTYNGKARRLNDGGGLYLLPRPNGGGSWVLRYQRAGKAAEAGLGSLAQVGAAEARALRAKMVASKAPAVVQRAARVATVAGQMTFRDAAEPVIAHYEAGAYHPATKAQWRSISERLLFPKIGHLTVDEIGRAEVLDILRPRWPSTTAERARAIIEAVIEEAKTLGHSDEHRANPALKRSLKASLKRFAPATGTRNHPSLPWADVPALMAKLYTPRSDRYHTNNKPSVSALALMFTILSGVRAGEAIGARWSEFKGDAWHIPAERMKQRKPHDVPISDGMRLVLDTLRPLKGPSPFVFPSYASAKPITPGAMLALLRELGYNDRTNVHGLRASFRTWQQKRGVVHQVGEATLAHYIGGTAGRYAQWRFFDERVPVMKAWSEHCLGALAKGRHLSAVS
jgi:integrase